ncbi:MAG: Cas10/Cmr2 second palm domain-containing protein [Myxococcota bacterium]
MSSDLKSLCKKTEANTRKAIQQAGARPWLVAYDVNGIQSLIAANSRPIAMYGASQWLKQFDTQQRKRAGAIFAAGGRGMLLASSEDKAKQLQHELKHTFFEQSFGGVLATASSPYDTKSAKSCLELLRTRLELAKDGATVPGGELPTSRADACADCHAFKGTVPSPRPDARHELICPRCDAFIRLSGKSVKQGSLIELSPDQQVAVVSADGNNLGQLFSSLSTLELCATVSALVGEIFAGAQTKAAAAVGNALISVASGGDDVRAFLAPKDSLTYVLCLTQTIEEGLTDAAEILSSVGKYSVLEETGAKNTLKAAGLGVGLLIANGAFPASRLLSLAHQLEDHAKQGCREGGWRSGLEVALMTAGELRIEAQTLDLYRNGHPFSLDADDWKQTRIGAEALKRVQSSQRSWLADIHRAEVMEEAHNQFRYQVARSESWKHYFASIGADWKQKEVMIDDMPKPGLLTLARLLEKIP